MDMAAGHGQARGRHARASQLHCAGIGGAALQHLKLERDRFFLGRRDQQLVEARMADHPRVLHLDGNTLPDGDRHGRRGVRDISRASHVQRDADLGIQSIGRGGRAAQPQFLLGRKHGMDDRGKHMARIVKEKKTIADTSHKLRFPTKEGAEEIKRALKKAAEETRREFEKQNKDLEKKHNDCKKAETDLAARTQAAEKNAQEARKAAGGIKEATSARDPMARAEKVSKEDAHFTKDHRTRQQKERERSSRVRDDQKRQLMNTRLSW